MSLNNHRRSDNFHKFQFRQVMRKKTDRLMRNHFEFYRCNVRVIVILAFCSLSISAPNRITHIDIPHEIVYLQNLTITGNRSYSSSNVICGTNVDLNQPFGNVVFGGGNIELINSDIEFNGQTIIEGNTSITVNNTY